MGKMNQNEVRPRSEQLLVQIRERRGKRVAEDGFKYYEIENPEDLLNWCVVNGYIFHGTSRKIRGELKPQPGRDLVKESGSRLAVYMTHNPALALFCSLSGGMHIKGGRQNECYMNIEDGKVSYSKLIFKVGELEKVVKEGYVYIFDKAQSDEYVNGEYLSYKPIKPLAVIKIKRADFKYPIHKIEED